MSSILVYIEHHQGNVKSTSKEMLFQAHRMAGDLSADVHAFVAGDDIASLSEQLGQMGVKKVFQADHKECASYHPQVFAQVLASACEQEKPLALMGSVSSSTKDLFPKVTARLDAAMISEGVEVKVDGGQIHVKRPMYSGKCFAWATIDASITSVLTFRPNVFDVTGDLEATTPEVVTLSVAENDLAGFECIERKQAASNKQDLTEAAIIVTAGRSIKEADNFKIMDELAEVLEASVGATRAAVDAGLAPHSMQIGQTGKVVNPKLYLAFGVSGAIQHLAGMRTSKVIVAVNTDKEAPIFEHADYGIVGDLFEVAPMMTASFKKLLSE